MCIDLIHEGLHGLGRPEVPSLAAELNAHQLEDMGC